MTAPEAEAEGHERSAAWHAPSPIRWSGAAPRGSARVRLAGRPAIRLCVTSHRTGPADLEAVVSALAEARKRKRGSPDRGRRA
ncbi:hypothetical protein [Nonomuraea dietziae]|uniref:hypothetical protein n=1 Tax=Nonomuraea dietziae TaxID=65515 RepID=UPI0031D20CFB